MHMNIIVGESSLSQMSQNYHIDFGLLWYFVNIDVNDL